MKRHFVIMYLQARDSVRCFVEESVTVPMYHRWCAARRGETNYCLRNAVTFSMCTLIPTGYRALLKVQFRELIIGFISLRKLL